jgi:predicted ATPase/class 3 adenylate cyclase
VLQIPTGTITLLFTDIEGSTRLLQRLGERYADVLKECRSLLRMAFQHCNGYEVDTQGDAFFVAFERGVDAVLSAIKAQRALFQASWPEGEVVRVRMGIHTGEPQTWEEGYVGLDVHCAARIMSIAHGGQVLLSRSARASVLPELPDDVDLRDLGEYRLKDIADMMRLYQLVIPDLPTDFPPLATYSSHQPFQNLPTPTTSFVGREKEVSTVTERLRQRDIRLLTLIGTGGVGKTRLALQAAAELNDSFTDGICFVALEQISDPEGVIPAIAQAMQVQEEKDVRLFEQLIDVMRDRSLMLILDNFEQLLPARSVVIDLLGACPKLKILITSRVMLHVRAEHLLEVAPFALPETQRNGDLTELSQNAAIALFVQRAQAVRADFELTEKNSAAIVAICRELDGIPLALELAAARLRHFSAPALADHLKWGLSVLQGVSYDAPARQQTLQSAIAWSYDLLKPTEQRAFRRLAVTVQEVTLEAAERICRLGTTTGMLEGSVAEALDALVDQSMLHRHERESGEVRFGLLQTMREYGLERLAETGELAAAQAAHAAYYLHWTEDIAPLLLGAEQAHWLDQLDRDYENVRTALEWLLESAQMEAARAEQALRLCTALLSYWETRSYVRDGLAYLERGLSVARIEHMGQSVAPAVRAQALHGAGMLALMRDDIARVEEFLRESQLLFRESGDKVGMANILRLQGGLAMTRTAYKLARRLLEESLQISRDLSDMAGIASTRNALAEVHIVQGNYAQARLLMQEALASYQASGEHYSTAYPLYVLARTHFLSGADLEQAQEQAEESRALFKEVGNRRLAAYARHVLGQIQLIQGEVGLAQATLEASLSTFRVLDERTAIGEVLMALGRLASTVGDYEAALAAYTESWELLRTTSLKALIASCLEGYGAILVAHEAPQKAVQLWGTAATVRATIIAPMPPVYRASYRQALALARQQLGETAFQSAWAEGHETSVEQAKFL